jgi:tetratricopeptide (TPR) repeat protein
MLRLVLLLVLAIVLLRSEVLQSPADSPADFEAERVLADKLFDEGKALQALPLYEDLTKRDPKRPAFAERHAAGLIAKSATVTEPSQKEVLLREAYNELLRARSLGDTSNYATVQLDSLRALFSPDAAKAAKAVLPPSPGYRESSNPKVIAEMQAGEAAFAKNDYPAALAAYASAAAEDPSYYGAPLYAGDTAFRMHDIKVAGEWFQKAIAIDPNRETAYRFWGDALLAENQPAAARDKFIDALIAEPYSRSSWAGFVQWGQRTHTPLSSPPIERPPACKDSHTLAAAADCFQRFIAEAKKPNAPAAQLDASSKSLIDLAENHLLNEWILLTATDPGIAQDYSAYREIHRDQLRTYIMKYIVRE